MSSALTGRVDRSLAGAGVVVLWPVFGGLARFAKAAAVSG
jgi:hypothetical protein